MTRSRKNLVCRPFLLAASVCALLGAATGTAVADFPMWEDHIVGDTYFAGDFTLADGVSVEFSPLHYPDGTSSSDHAKVSPEDTPCNQGNLIAHFAITSKYDFLGSIGPVTNPVFLTKHQGNIINLSINGSAIAFAGKWADYHATMESAFTFVDRCKSSFRAHDFAFKPRDRVSLSIDI